MTSNPLQLEPGIYCRYLKPVLDFCFALLLTILLLPLLALLALAVKWDSPGPALYRGKRLGRGGKAFDCYKLRTMVLNADEKLDLLLRQDPQLKAEWDQDQKLRRDPRITRLGNFLRKSSLDELPQLFNILKGEMSFIGPRPILVEQQEFYGDDFAYYQQCRPGITGLWQVSGRNHLSYKQRIVLEKRYAMECSLFLDWRILWKTFPVILSRKGAY